MSNNIEVKACFGCHASYNDGFLFDKWYDIEDTIDLDDAIEKFEKHVIKSIKSARPDWVKDGYITDTYAEELYLSDIEVYIDNIFINLDIGESISELRDFLEVMENSFNTPIGLLIQVMENRGASFDDLKSIDDDLFYFEVDSKSDSDLAYAYCEITDMFTQYGLPDDHTLIQYFDYDSFGHQLKTEYTIYDIDGNYYAVSDS